MIARHIQTFRLRAGDGVLLSNTRWLHGRDRYSGRRTMLRVLGDPLPGTGIMPGFPSPAPATRKEDPAMLPHGIEITEDDYAAAGELSGLSREDFEQRRPGVRVGRRYREKSSGTTMMEKVCSGMA